MRGLLVATALLCFVHDLPAQTIRPTGTVGEYIPPKAWPVRARSFDLLHQRIAISFDLDSHALSGDVETRLVVTGTATDSIRLDASNLAIDAASYPSGKKLKFFGDSAGVTVRLARRAQPGDTVTFDLKYRGRPERGMYFVPRRGVMWTQGEAIETRSWVPTYDAPNDKTTWDILVTADTGMSVLSNGRLVDVTPAAGGRAQVWHWAQELPASTYLYSIVAGRFTVLRDSWRGVPVEYWVSADTLDAGWRTFGETPSMIEIYSRVLGVNFPWAKYDQSVIPDFTYGGMENVSATTQTDLALHSAGGEPESSGRGLNAHELAHQWFGDLTTTANWAHIWLNEGLTTYMESVQEEKSRGWEAAQFNWINQQQAAMAADKNGERPLVLGETPGEDPITLFFSGHVYPKGAQVAHQLRRLLGDSVFWAGMHRFLSDNAFKPVETKDFAVAMEKASGQDLDWFFDQWAYGIGYPKVKVSRAWDEATKTLNVTVEETQPIDETHPFFRFPATVRIVTRDSVVRHEIMVTGQQQQFALSLPTAPVTFRFDEGGWLLGTVTTDQKPEELAALARHDVEFAARYWALSRLDGSTAEPAQDARRFIVLNEPSPWLRQEAVRQLASDGSAESRAVVASALQDPDGVVRGEAVVSIARLDSVAAQPIAVEMIGHDPNDYARSQALSIYDPAIAAEGTALLVAQIAHGGSNGVRTEAAERLLGKPDEAGRAALEAMTATSEPRNLRTFALGLLAKWPDTETAARIATRGLGDGDQLFASYAAATLGRIGGAPGHTALEQALRMESRVTVRAAIANALHS